MIGRNSAWLEPETFLVKVQCIAAYHSPEYEFFKVFEKSRQLEQIYYIVLRFIYDRLLNRYLNEMSHTKFSTKNSK
jgi:hypothetical protein